MTWETKAGLFLTALITLLATIGILAILTDTGEAPTPVEDIAGHPHCPTDN